MQFQYLIDKIDNSQFGDYPFSHIQINTFFNEDHLRQILATKEIAISGVASDEELFSSLFEQASYNHLNGQRTQMYGNLWYKEKEVKGCPAWEDFVVKAKVPVAIPPTLTDKVKSFVPPSVKDLIRGKKHEDANVIANRRQ